jgi:hypothetical protein
METNQRQWVKISKAGGQAPFSVSTIYKMHHRRENLHLFSKVGGSVFVNIPGLWALIDEGAEEKRNVA